MVAIRRMAEEEDSASRSQAGQCRLVFADLGQRQVVGEFDGGSISSDGGAVLLSAVDKRARITERFSQCFTDHRNPDLIEHSVQELTAQRIYGIALGYEDLNDHDDLRRDPLLAVVVGKEDPTGTNRRREQDRGKALGGKSTLNRLELTAPEAGPESRYKKIVLNEPAVDRLLVEYFLDAVGEEPSEIVLDIDATNDPVHGEQEGRYFQGYYDQYCYLPLYIFCAEHLLLARLRPGWVDGPEGSVDELERIVAQIRQRWPNVHIIVRGDSAFAREEIMHWAEQTPGVDYVFGLAKNPRLERQLERTTFWARARRTLTGGTAREFDELSYQTLDSWSRPRRVIGKAEVSAAGDNPRFVVTSLEPQHSYKEAQEIYEQLYCARGDMENRIKEQQLHLFADRTSCSTLRANQIRLYMASVAYVLMQAARRLGLAGTTMAKAQCATIRNKLLKIGAHIRVTVRKVWISFSSAYPYQKLFFQVYRAITGRPSTQQCPAP